MEREVFPDWLEYQNKAPFSANQSAVSEPRLCERYLCSRSSGLRGPDSSDTVNHLV